MVTFSAFADEIAKDLKTQMAVCAAQGVRCIDVRAIDDVNVSKFTLPQAKEYRRQLAGEGFSVPCVASPIGKSRIDEPFAGELDLLRHCFDVAKELGAPYVRVFSFFPPKDGRIADHRAEVMERLGQMVRAAEAAGLVLLHENERAIYGATPEGVLDIFRTIRSPYLKSIFDAANFVAEDIAPHDAGWMIGLDELTYYFHIKDMVRGQKVCVPAGEGDGQIPQTLADAVRHGFAGYLTLEPHMAVSGPSSGFTGPELFAKAVAGLRKVCDQVGLKYR